MSEIKDIADTEFDDLSQHVDLGKLEAVESFVRETVGRPLSSRRRYTIEVRQGWDTRDGRCEELCSGMDSCQGSSPSSFHWSKNNKGRAPI